MAAPPGFAGGGSPDRPRELSAVVWTPVEISLEAASSHVWWEFPVTAVFTHAGSGTRLELPGFWDGDRRYVVRFAPPRRGAWTFRTRSADKGLDAVRGTISARTPSAAELRRNGNLRGHLRISPDGRYFTYADGTPFFLLGDTVWAMNTARCGLGENSDGPFYVYLADRGKKGFTTIFMSFMRGFGDTTMEPAGQRNEGGYPFVDADPARLNPAYFRALDARMRAIWERGFVTAGHPTWFGKHNCFFDRDTARRIVSYLAVRYAAFNHIWSLSGEFQYALRDCEWSPEDFHRLGRTLQALNPYRHPVSAHPSGRTHWEAPFNVQSSRGLIPAGWIDHNWLQTGQSAGRLFNIPLRLQENYALSPPMPALLAEGFYERASDRAHAYHARWQAWTAFLSGAAGYGYGAFGIWQFYDPEDPYGETGKPGKDTIPWREALELEGSGQLRFVRQVLTGLEWWSLRPHREWLVLNGRENPMPGPKDISPPHCAARPGRTYVVYIPRGNADKRLLLTHLAKAAYEARWVDPRTGAETAVDPPPQGVEEWLISARPEPAGEDWVLVLTADRRRGPR